MAGLPPPPPAGVPPPLPVPAAPTPSVYYRDFFNDATNDPFNGHYTDVLADYACTAGAIRPQALRDLIANARLQNVPTAFLLQHEDDKCLHIYLQLERFEPRMGLPASQWDNLMFASKGELRFNNHQTVLFDNDNFNQTGFLRVPTPNLIDTELAADPHVRLLGPYVHGDADTELVRCRRTCFVPAPYVALFLAHPLSPREAWNQVRAQIVTDNREVDCQPLIDFLRAALTIDAGLDSGVEVEVPEVPITDADLDTRRHRILQQDFPLLNPNLAAVQHTQIATHLGALVTESQTARAEKAARLATARNKPPEDYLGPVGTTRLLRYCNIGTPQQFPPFWSQLSRSPKQQHLSVLQWEITRVKTEINAPDLPFTATAAVLEAIKSLHWEMNNNDAVTSGLNLFLLPDDNESADSISAQALYDLMHSDGAAPSLQDATSLLKAKPGAPKFIYQARQQTRRFEIIIRICLGSNHPMATQLSAYNNRMLACEAKLHSLQVDQLLLPTMLCKKVAVAASNWFRSQSSTPAPHPCPNFCQVFDDIDNEAPWHPVMSPAFLAALNLTAIQTPTRTSTAPVIPPVVTPPNAVTTTPPGATNVADPGHRNNNVSFNTTLFGTYKDSGVPCRVVRAKIARGDAPALPNSKANAQMEMCLGWHVKGMCNSNCSRSADHIPYTATEYAPLVQWCTAHFPSE